MTLKFDPAIADYNIFGNTKIKEDCDLLLSEYNSSENKYQHFERVMNILICDLYIDIVNKILKERNARVTDNMAMEADWWQGASRLKFKIFKRTKYDKHSKPYDEQKRFPYLEGRNLLRDWLNYSYFKMPTQDMLTALERVLEVKPFTINQLYLPDIGGIKRLYLYGNEMMTDQMQFTQKARTCKLVQAANEAFFARQRLLAKEQEKSAVAERHRHVDQQKLKDQISAKIKRLFAPKDSEQPQEA